MKVVASHEQREENEKKMIVYAEWPHVLFTLRSKQGFILKLVLEPAQHRLVSGTCLECTNY